MRNALVTGGTRGIGKAIVARLVDDGFNCVVVGRDQAALDAAVAELSSPTVQVVGLACDVTQPDQVSDMIETARETLGSIDVLVNCAGRSGGGVTKNIADELWRDVIDTNLNAVFYVTKEVLRSRVMGAGGAVINIASTGGKQGVIHGAPYSASRPYDASRSGFVLAEGCGILVLEDLHHAKRRGATILAELTGFGSTCNAYHMTDLQPEGVDLHRAMVLALEDAGLDPRKIDYVNAHGSSTPQNDINETNAVKRTLGERANDIPVVSLKSVVGHALAGANTVELVSLVQTVVHQETPPTTPGRAARASTLAFSRSPCAMPPAVRTSTAPIPACWPAPCAACWATCGPTS